MTKHLKDSMGDRALDGHAFYGPWTVVAYFPLGGVALLHRRWKMKITGESIPEAASFKRICRKSAFHSCPRTSCHGSLTAIFCAAAFRISGEGLCSLTA